MLESLPLFSSGAAAAGSCPQLRSKSLGLPDLSVCRPGNLASEPGGATAKKHENKTIEASMLLKTQGVTLETKLKRTQNEPNFERQMHRLSPNSELSSEVCDRAGGLRLKMLKGTARRCRIPTWHGHPGRVHGRDARATKSARPAKNLGNSGTEAIRSRKPAGSREKTENNTIEANMLLKIKEGVWKRTQNEPNFERRMRGQEPEIELAVTSRVAPVGLCQGKE